jgi:thiol-disulfide isomerase/thioredoxin
MLVVPLLGGCDRQSGAVTQQAESANSAEAAAAPAPASGFDRSHRGSPIPDLTVSGLDGKPVALASLKGKPLLVNLWATWCGPCVTELPTLDQLAGDKAASLRIVEISQDSGADGAAAAKVKTFWESKNLAHLSTLIDPGGDAMTKYGATTLPTTLYYDAQGREVWRLTGNHDWSSPDTVKLLAETAG